MSLLLSTPRDTIAQVWEKFCSKIQLPFDHRLSFYGATAVFEKNVVDVFVLDGSVLGLREGLQNTSEWKTRLSGLRGFIGVGLPREAADCFLTLLGPEKCLLVSRFEAVEWPKVKEWLLEGARSTFQQRKQEVQPEKALELSPYLKVMDSLQNVDDSTESLQEWLALSAAELQCVRVSIVLTEKNSDSAVVLNGWDRERQGSRSVVDYAISLVQYPEFQEVLETGQPLVVDLTTSTPTGLAKKLSAFMQRKQAFFQLLAPVKINGEVIAILAMRRTTKGFSSADIQLSGMLACALARYAQRRRFLRRLGSQLSNS